MGIAELFITRPVYTWILILTCLIGGVWALSDIGRLEDPEFTIKRAKIYTRYPGATAEQVEQEVTEKLEVAIQQLGQLKDITSLSRPGLSEITVKIRDEFSSAELPQIWDELRRKVRDAQSGLPRGAAKPVINDDFGDVYGIYYAVTAEGFSYSEMREITKHLRRELLTVEGVAKVSRSGLIRETAYLAISEARLAQFGFSLDDLSSVLKAKTATQKAGEIEAAGLRPRLRVDDGLEDMEAIRNILVGEAGSTAMLHVRDIADTRLGYEEQPQFLAHYNGKKAVLLGVSAAPNTNIVEVGERVETKLKRLSAGLPLGVELAPVYQQHQVVADSVDGFLFNLLSSVVIVTLVLCVFMGWRSGVVVGSILGLTVLGTVLIMNLMGLNLQRISLGALIIAMGMLVDNAIVVAEGMLMGVQQRESPLTAAKRVVRQTFWPLLGATVIGIMAFSGIGLSDDSTGEFLFSLFAVIGISLLLSWVLAITVTPYLGYYLYRPSKVAHEGDPYGGRLYRLYHDVLRKALAHRAITVALLVVVTAASYYGFGFIKQGFFPNSNAPLFYVNYWLPQGSDIHRTDKALQVGSAFLREQEEVESVTSVAGRGADRFMLTYRPEPLNRAYGQLIVRTHDRDQIPAVIERLLATLPDRQPQAHIMVERLVFGPSTGADEEARLSGPDPAVLRQLGTKIEAVYRDHGIEDIRQDWRQPESVIVAHLNEERARVAGVSDLDIARTLQFASSGYKVADYEKGDRTIPVVARLPARDRNGAGMLEDRLVWSSTQRSYIPAGQLVDSFETTTEEALVHRRNRVRTLTVKGEAPEGETAMSAFAHLRPAVEAMALPAGYTLEWGGEYESTRNAQSALAQGLPLGILVMVITSVLLFGTVREPIVIWLVVPMSLVGVVVGLLSTGMPFGFMSLLGVLSLSGMLIKNAVVLVDEIQEQMRKGLAPMNAIETASVSRLRPVALAAITTILGMSPLLADAFFADMAVTIMGGLGFATVLTLVAVPVFYSIFHRVPREGA